MYARIATFESDPAKVDDAISMVRAEVESGDTPAGLEGAKMLMLVNRETGRAWVTLFESEEAMRRGDEALNAMNPGSTERRTSVEFYEVPVQTVSRAQRALRAEPGQHPFAVRFELRRADARHRGQLAQRLGVDASDLLECPVAEDDVRGDAL